MKISNKGKIAGALGLAAGVATIATGYYFYGKNGKEHRKEAMEWTEKAKMEMLDKIRQMKDLTENAYHKAVDEVLKKYKAVKKIDPKELQIFGEELKTHWKQISKDAAKLAKKGAPKSLKGDV